MRKKSDTDHDHIDTLQIDRWTHAMSRQLGIAIDNKVPDEIRIDATRKAYQCSLRISESFPDWTKNDKC